MMFDMFVLVVVFGLIGGFFYVAYRAEKRAKMSQIDPEILRLREQNLILQYENRAYAEMSKKLPTLIAARFGADFQQYQAERQMGAMFPPTEAELLRLEIARGAVVFEKSRLVQAREDLEGSRIAKSAADKQRAELLEELAYWRQRGIQQEAAYHDEVMQQAATRQAEHGLFLPYLNDDVEDVDIEPVQPVKNKGGRPRKHANPAARQKAHRDSRR
ncbi:hypothetical protein MIS33_08330 [Wielerella bovis]|uniref:hypothetical protein n=1 Tax=Wielerella bovis TaxID=2917790 RepID=UPI002018A221|nr:hypothetical protein [Wielerella bovis]ULJ64157.1 hypothetical protein MIS33_08330 [Wielerella bovis]